MAIRPTIKPLIEPITNRDEALAVVTHLHEVMDALLKTIEQETALVRGGRLIETAKLEPAKTRLAQLYVADVARLKASASYLEKQQPKLLADLKQRHVAFHANLQVNLTVLATAHAVAEGIVRGVSAEVTQKARPQVYGSTGRSAGVPPRQSQPLAVSRVL
jgi:hypothetical protein